MNAAQAIIWSIPLVAGLVGWFTNWLAIRMSFYPVLPVRLNSWLMWQGIIPRKAEKMAHICIDRTLNRLGNLNDIYQRLDPQMIAHQVLRQVTPRLEEYVDEVMYELQPVLWDNLPMMIRRRIYRWAADQLPKRIEALVADLGQDLSGLVDLKKLISEELKSSPDLMNRIFQQAGQKELHFVIVSGGVIGALLGLLLLPVWMKFQSVWLLPVAGFVIGYVTNWLAVNLLFRPLEPRQLMGWPLQGLFLKRQAAISDVWSRLVADELITVEKVAHAMVHGVYAHRTRALIQKNLRPLLDQSSVMRLAAQVTVGMSGYTDLKMAMNEKAVDATQVAFHDVDFNKNRAPIVAQVIREQLLSLSPEAFQDVLRPAFQEEEYLLMLAGGSMGLLAGLLQQGLFSWLG